MLKRIHQNGSMMIMAIFAIGVALAGFTALGLGQMMWQKREIQKIADATARTAAAQLGDAPTFTQAREVATSNGLTNGDAILFECLAGSANAVTTCTATPEAVRVTVTRNLKPLFFVAGTTLRAFASAEPSPVVTASITTGLVTLDTAQSALLNSILSSIGGGNVNLVVAGSSGLINTTASVDLLRLSTGLGVTSLQELVNLRVGLGTLLDTGNVAAGVPLLDLSLKSILDQIRLPIGQLINVDLTQADAARALINLGDLAVAGLLGSVQGRSIDLRVSNMPAGVSVKVLVVEAPRILIARQKRGVRPVGFLRSGQVKVETNFSQNISSLLAPLGLTNLAEVGLLVGGLYVQASGAEVTVNELVCKMPRSLNETRFTATNSLLKICLSDKPSNFADTANTPISCGNPATVLSLKSNGILGQVLNIAVKAKIELNGTSTPTTGVLFGKNPDPAFRIPNATGQSLSNLLTGASLRLTLETSLLSGLASILLNPLLSAVTSGLLPVVSQALSPILIFTGNTVDSILRLPGIGVNDAFFDVQRLDCSGSRLIQ